MRHSSLCCAMALLGTLACKNRGFHSEEPDSGESRRRLAIDLVRQDLRKALETPPLKRDRDGNPVEEPWRRSSERETADGGHALEHDSIRAKMCRRNEDGTTTCLSRREPGRAPPGEFDNPGALLDAPREIVRRLEEMSKRKLQNARLAEPPWSGAAWSVAQGLAAARYADAPFRETGTHWARLRDLVMANPLSAILASGRQEELDALSPAEKYDLLLGDGEGTLTKNQWNEALVPTDPSQASPRSLSLGWARAAMALPRPRSVLRLATGSKLVTFFPDDLKALASLLHERSEAPVKFVGQRCATPRPIRSPSGRRNDPHCFDFTPALWHVAIVNRIGIERRSLAMDATFDPEIRNVPVFGYSYSFFNPSNGKPANNATDAAVAVAAFGRDPFKAFRNPHSRTIVGVSMSVAYVVETNAVPEASDASGHDGIRQVEYLYDLELDADGNIVDGEWYLDAHPDFLWAPDPGMRAESPYDRALRGTWRPGAPLPASFRPAAARSSAWGLPLAGIVVPLVETSASTPLAADIVRFETEKRGDEARIPQSGETPETVATLDVGEKMRTAQSIRVAWTIDYPEHRLLNLRLARGEESITLVRPGDLEGKGPRNHVQDLDEKAKETLARSSSGEWRLIVSAKPSAYRGTLARFALEFR